jgi:hypothetical protein
VTTSVDQQGLQQGMASATGAYIYLRSAQQNTEAKIKVSKFPDPLLALEKDQMWTIRRHLLRCMQNSFYVIRRDPRLLTQCTESLTHAVQKLEVLIAMMP